jgi:hypothetical protein
VNKISDKDAASKAIHTLDANRFTVSGDNRGSVHSHDGISGIIYRYQTIGQLHRRLVGGYIQVTKKLTAAE